MQDILAGKVERLCNLSASSLLPIAFFTHQRMAGQPKLDARAGVNCIVDTAVAWNKTTQQAAVCGVDNSVAFQLGYVALPKEDSAFDRRQAV